MAITPHSNEAFLREVDEELRRDQLAGFWTRWGRWVVVAIVAALAIFGGVLYWQHHQEAAAGVEGEKLQEAFDLLGAGKFPDAQAKLAPIAQSSRPGYRALAIFSQADIALQKNDLKRAATLFATVASDTAQADAFRNLALVRQTSAEYDMLKPQVVIDRLRPLAVPGNPWFGSAGEMMAIADLRTGRRDLAGALFGQIARDDAVPQTIRQRAVQMAGLLGVDASAAIAAPTLNQDVKAQ
ncbi:tetratricopeptide repeat protein [Sphingomonas bacterium]|uniref:tetratricopeptide repeat protein n=1 Tax=Sphingomonas bacterium TaxID=1895847 RepID=UPI0015756C6F|nr:tetratricopeptide repeat protein [Sphingomonas bacterium]